MECKFVRFVYCWCFFLFLLSVWFAYFYGYREVIPGYKIIMQVFIGVFYVGNLLLCTKINNIRMSTMLVFVNMLMLSCTLRMLFWDYTNDPYDGIVCDTRSYELLAVKNVGISYGQYCLKIIAKYNFDDLGYYSILYFLHNLFRDIDFVRNALLLINAVSLAIMTQLIYKLVLLVGFDSWMANNVATFYGFFPFWIIFSAMGLKEVIFCLLVVSALYSIYKFKDKHSFVNFCLVLLLVASTYLFRFAITLMLILIFVFILIVNETNRKKILVTSFIGIIIFFVFANVILVAFTGISLDAVQNVSANRMKGSTGVGGFGWMMQILAALFGPFPNFLRTVGWGFYYSSGLLLKSLTSIFVLIGSYRIIKNLEWRLYPILLYFIMGIVMLVISSVSFDMRYHITFFPAYVILLFYGLDKIKSKVSFILFSIFIISVVATYNIR